MIIGPQEREAFALLTKALAAGYPVRPRDVLPEDRFERPKVSKLTRAFARSGAADYGRRANVDWLIPRDPRLDLEEFHLIQSPSALAALAYAIDAKLFTQRRLFEAVASAEGTEVTPRVRRTATAIWHMDLVELKSETESVKYFSVTARGRRLFAAARDYHVPAFAEAADRGDLAKFHTLIELDAVVDV